MRVLVYAPAEMRGRERHVQATQQELARRGHECMGEVDNPAAARAARETGLVDAIACRPDHLPDLVDWAMPLDPPNNRPQGLVAVAGPVAVMIDRAESWITGAAQVL